MKKTLIAAGITFGLVAALGLAAVWLFSWPFRLMSRMAGVGSARREHRTMIALAVESTAALVLSALGLRRAGRRIGPSWHPCEECGQPIDAPSKAAFCSESCRRHQSIRRRAQIISDTDFA